MDFKRLFRIMEIFSCLEIFFYGAKQAHSSTSSVMEIVAKSPVNMPKPLHTNTTWDQNQGGIVFRVFLIQSSTLRVCVVFGFRVECWKLDFLWKLDVDARTLPSIRITLECNIGIFRCRLGEGPQVCQIFQIFFFGRRDFCLHTVL
jgi:hypothetical protein